MATQLRTGHGHCQAGAAAATGLVPGSVWVVNTHEGTFFCLLYSPRPHLNLFTLDTHLMNFQERLSGRHSLIDVEAMNHWAGSRRRWEMG